MILKIMKMMMISTSIGVVNGAVFQNIGEGKVVRGEKKCYSGVKLTETHCPDDFDAPSIYSSKLLGSKDSLVVDLTNLKLSGEGPHSRGASRSLDEDVKTFKGEFYLIPTGSISTTSKPDPNMRCCWDNTQNFCDFNMENNDAKEEHLPQQCKGEDGNAQCSARMGLDYNAVGPMGGGGMSGIFQSEDKSYVYLDLAVDPEVGKFPEINFELKPAAGEQMYMLLVSNCALITDGMENKVNYLCWDAMTLTWVLSDGGNLGEMGGLIWFYGLTFSVYAVLATQWIRKSLEFQGNLLGLQKAVR